MPLGKNVRYRYKKGTHIRLAFQGNKVVEAKNMQTGATHTPSEFKADRARKYKRSNAHRPVSHRRVVIRRKKRGGR